MSATHRQLADRFGVSTIAVAMVREVKEGTSVSSQRALEETEVDHLIAAAKWLARAKGCHAASEEITRELVKGVGV